MNIASTQFTLKHKSFEIYLSGCNGFCDGCCNPELKDFNIGLSFLEKIDEIINKIQIFDLLINDIWILGGDPIDNKNDELFDLILKLKPLKKNIWLWTRYNIEDIPNNIKCLCDYIKCGEYLKNLQCDNNIQYGIKLATSNQKIYYKEDF